MLKFNQGFLSVTINLPNYVTAFHGNAHETAVPINKLCIKFIAFEVHQNMEASAKLKLMTFQRASAQSVHVPDLSINLLIFDDNVSCACCVIFNIDLPTFY